MDIRGLGDKLSEQLIEKKAVKNLAGIYSLTASDLAELDRMGEKSAQNLVEAIENSKKRPLSALLVALGIRFVGDRVAEILAGHFGSMEALRNTSEDELAQAGGIGPVIASSVEAFFSDAANRELLARLEESGLSALTAQANGADVPLPVRGGILSGMTVVFTGEMSSLTRDEAEKLVKEQGGKATKSVSAKTSLVVAGDKAGSKLDKATALGVRIIDEAEFLEMVSHSNLEG